MVLDHPPHDAGWHQDGRRVSRPHRLFQGKAARLSRGVCSSVDEWWTTRVMKRSS
jgi:hypothetical protein